MSRAQILIAAILFVAAMPVTPKPGEGGSIFPQLNTGDNHQITFTDVDGNALSTADGHITTIVLTTQSGIDKARAVGDRTPDLCLGNSTYQMVTVLAFEKRHSKPVRMILSSLIRRRVDTEGRRLQDRYDKLKIARDARRDVFAVADFDGTVTTQLGAQPVAGLFQVFVFGRHGELTKQWNDVPSVDDLAAVLK
jgi:hypothetical protein